MEIKNKYGYRSELKSVNTPLTLYKELLELINELEIPVYYRIVDKEKYKGQFAIAGDKKLHNVFDEYNLAKLSDFTGKNKDLKKIIKKKYLYKIY
ncbi:MAG: hypothetical protein Q7K54_01075 [Candidatus Parcubacteria bacterium]|nr:hypothetical protein [Candidatus Parcubacteria bacterium]